MTVRLALLQRRSASAPQRGSVAIEAALAIPILIGVGLIGADMQRIHTERIRVESTAGTLALNVAAQPFLTAAGFDALASASMQGHSDAQRLTVLYIAPSGRITWALQRGGASGLCEPPAAAGLYTGNWPGTERPNGQAPDTDDPGAVTRPQIAVQVCRSTRDIPMNIGLDIPDVIQTQVIYPAAFSPLELDDVLAAESGATGLAYSASTSATDS